MNKEQIYDRNNKTLKHSGFGIASFITCLAVSLVLFFLTYVLATVDAGAPVWDMDKQPSVRIIAEMGIIGCLFFYLVGVAFGIAGIVQKNRYKILPILGIALNGVMFLATVVPSMIGAVPVS